MKYINRLQSLRKVSPTIFLVDKGYDQLLIAKQEDTIGHFQDLESKKLLDNLVQFPNNFALHNQRSSNPGIA